MSALTSKDHYELMDMFEREFAGFGRLDKEDKSLWAKGQIYQHGDMNNLFLAYRKGASYGAAISR